MKASFKLSLNNIKGDLITVAKDLNPIYSEDGVEVYVDEVEFVERMSKEIEQLLAGNEPSEVITLGGSKIIEYEYEDYLPYSIGGAYAGWYRDTVVEEKDVEISMWVEDYIVAEKLILEVSLEVVE